MLPYRYLCNKRALFLHVAQGSRFKLMYDGMIHHLEIPRCRQYDSGEVRVVAKNQIGEDESVTNLSVLPQDDWRAGLRRTPRDTCTSYLRHFFIDRYGLLCLLLTCSHRSVS